MSKIAYIADVHVGNHKAHGGKVVAGINRRCEMTLEVLTDALDIAEQRGVQDVVVLGDLFDGTRPSPQIIRAAQDVLRGGNRRLLLGNHERVSGLHRDNSLGPLVAVEDVWLYTEPRLVKLRGDGYHLMAPFQDGPAREWLPKEVEKVAGGSIRSLCIHLGVRDDSVTDKWAVAADDVVSVRFLVALCKKYGIRQVFAGNWHGYHRWEVDDVVITQVGALCPTGWNNPGLGGYGRVVISDGDPANDEVLEVPGPRFIEVTSKEELPPLPSRKDRFPIFVRFKVPPEQVHEAQYWMDELDLSGLVVDVVVDKKEASESVRRATSAVRASSTMTEAVEAYFQEIKLKVDPGKVQARVMRYLGLR